MSDIAIRVDNLSKQYHIGGPQKTYSRLGDQLADMALTPFRRTGKLLRGQFTGASELDDTIWALKDVSLEIRSGEVVGIIGHNGAGKSTLLKILSRITKPTGGYVDLYGRVGSLLEVGTGFHPELTGRENVYLNGAILGMRREEINRKFDEIVAFAEIGKFLDTPVKHYSSGMQVRLAFAVAAHLEPEILLVDEVLAVGDAAFQNKCLGKMGDVVEEGRTVLFVSHNMAAVQSLCTRCLLINQGQLVYQGSAAEVVQHYLQAQVQRQQAVFGPNTIRQGTGRAQYVQASILNDEGNLSSAIGIGEGFSVELRFETNDHLVNPRFGVVIRNILGQRLAYLVTHVTHGAMPEANQGGVVRLHIDRFDVLPGLYYLTLGLSLRGEKLDFIESALELKVLPKDVYPGGKLPPPGTAIMYIPCHWSQDYQ